MSLAKDRLAESVASRLRSEQSDWGDRNLRDPNVAAASQRAGDRCLAHGPASQRAGDCQKDEEQ